MTSENTPRPRMMVVEPDRLTRWSITSYFDGRYTVVTAESVDGARALLRRLPIDAVVVADDFPAGGADAVVSDARSRNGSVKIVLMGTSPASSMRCPEAPRLEKPFQLESLAELLGD